MKNKDKLSELCGLLIEKYELKEKQTNVHLKEGEIKDKLLTKYREKISCLIAYEIWLKGEDKSFDQEDVSLIILGSRIVYRYIESVNRKDKRVLLLLFYLAALLLSIVLGLW